MDKGGVYDFFDNEVAMVAFILLFKFGGGSSIETRLSAFIGADASFSKAMDELNAYVGRLQDEAISKHEVKRERSNEAIVQMRVASRSKTVPHRSGRELNNILSVAAVNLFNECFQKHLWT